ncbi:YchJ family metal-binding protein, partial [Neisseria meningitidis]
MYCLRLRRLVLIFVNPLYIIATTVPAQQTFLDAAELMQWSRETEWLGLNVIAHRNFGKQHAQVEFEAYFRDGQHRSAHHELS